MTEDCIIKKRGQTQLIVGDEWKCKECGEGIMIETWNPLTGKQWYCNKCGDREW